jgi:hypothetical protein
MAASHTRWFAATTRSQQRREDGTRAVAGTTRALRVGTRCGGAMTPPLERSNLPNADLLLTSTSANCADAIGSDLRSAYVEAVLPYPHGRPDLHRTTLCSRENAVVLKRPECFTCSWCVLGSEAMVTAVLDAHNCKVSQMRTRKTTAGGASLSPRAA